MPFDRQNREIKRQTFASKTEVIAGLSIWHAFPEIRHLNSRHLNWKWSGNFSGHISP